MNGNVTQVLRMAMHAAQAGDRARTQALVDEAAQYGRVSQAELIRLDRVLVLARTHKKKRKRNPPRRRKAGRTAPRAAATRRRAIKRQLRLSGVAIPASAMYDIRKLRALRRKGKGKARKFKIRRNVYTPTGEGYPHITPVAWKGRKPTWYQVKIDPSHDLYTVEASNSTLALAAANRISRMIRNKSA